MVEVTACQGGGAMSAAREEMLARIRSVIGVSPIGVNKDYDAIPREYIRTGALDEHQRLELFADRLQDYDAPVHRAAEADLPRTIGECLRARGKHRIVIPADFPAEWLPDSFDFIRDHELSYDDLDRAEGVLTACTIAIAFTGTIILQDAPAQGRRALSLIPDYHLCIVRTAQVVETVPEAFRFLEASRSRATTTISGPSATADIEMTRIKGVHGPRDLEVVLWAANPA